MAEVPAEWEYELDLSVTEGPGSEERAGMYALFAALVVGEGCSGTAGGGRERLWDGTGSGFIED